MKTLAIIILTLFAAAAPSLAQDADALEAQYGTCARHHIPADKCTPEVYAQLKTTKGRASWSRDGLPSAEATGSYQFEHVSLVDARLNLSRGWEGSVNVPITRWLDSVGEVSRSWKKVAGTDVSSSCVYYGDCITTAVTASVYTFGGGAQLNYRTARVQPFARFILGDARLDVGASLGGLGVSAGTSAFFIAPGGGVDVRVARHVWLHTGIDWLHATKDGVTVSGFRALGGFRFTFGGGERSSAVASAPAPTPAAPPFAGWWNTQKEAKP